MTKATILRNRPFVILVVLSCFALFTPASAYPSASMSTDAAQSSKTVMVTGSNGFLASYIVQQLLEKGHSVHACVRDATKEDTVAHLRRLPHAAERLKLFSTGDLADSKGKFDEPMDGCDAVFHAATPLSPKFADYDGERDILAPAMASTQEILDCIGRHKNTVRCIVLTSSMSAVAPQPEPPVKDESHWSDPDAQQSRGNWYGCTKTRQERLVELAPTRVNVVAPDGINPDQGVPRTNGLTQFQTSYFDVAGV